MEQFKMKIAQKVIEVNCIYMRTWKFDYRGGYVLGDTSKPTIELTDDPTDVFVSVTEEELPKRIARDREMGLWKDVTDSECLRQNSQLNILKDKIIQKLFENGILHLHSSIISVDGKAYAFTAPSTTGKSTMTKHWMDVFGDRAVMVNDDEPFLRFEKGKVYACGSPWRGKHSIGNNIEVELAGICLIYQDKTNHIHRVTDDEIDEELLVQLEIDDVDKEEIRPYLEKIKNIVPLYKMGCSNSMEAVSVAYNGMKVKNR